MRAKDAGGVTPVDAGAGSTPVPVPFLGPNSYKGKKNHMANSDLQTQALKDLISYLSNKGHTYSLVSSMTKEEHRWTGTAIKQFMYRTSKPRINEKLLDLVRVVLKLYNSIPSDEQTSNAEILTEMCSSYGVQSQDSFSTEIGNRFRKLRHKGKQLDLPEQFAFARLGRDAPDRKIYVLFVSVQRSDNGYTFAMRVSGSNSRRVIVGDVSETNNSVYFSGIAYRYVLHEKEFQNFDPFDIGQLNEGTSNNEIGIETLALASHHLPDPVAPVCFTGLDGRGFPISGIGAIIAKERFEDFDFHPQELRSKFDFRTGDKLSDELIKMQAGTYAPVM